MDKGSIKESGSHEELMDLDIEKDSGRKKHTQATSKSFTDKQRTNKFEQSAKKMFRQKNQRGNKQTKAERTMLRNTKRKTNHIDKFRFISLFRSQRMRVETRRKVCTVIFMRHSTARAMPARRGQSLTASCKSLRR